MKKRRLFIAIGMIFAISAVVLVLAKTQVDYRNLAQVKIKIVGTMVPSGNEYMLSYEGGTWIASHNEIVWMEDKLSEAAVDAAFTNRIIEILKENKAHKWDDFSLKREIGKKLSSIATDGENYSFYMYFSDGTAVAIEGYDDFPENFMSVFRAFEKEFETLFPEKESY